MCPVCMTTAALVAAGTTSGAGVLGFVAVQLRRLRVFQSDSSPSVSEQKGERQWQEAKRETATRSISR